MRRQQAGPETAVAGMAAAVASRPGQAGPEARRSARQGRRVAAADTDRDAGGARQRAQQGQQVNRGGREHQPLLFQTDTDLVAGRERHPRRRQAYALKPIAEQARHEAAAAALTFGTALAGRLAVASHQDAVALDLQHGGTLDDHGTVVPYCAATAELWRCIDRAIMRTVSAGTSPTAVT